MESTPLSYQAFKAIVLEKRLWWQYDTTNDRYDIYATDGPNRQYTTSILLNPADFTGMTEAEKAQSAADKADFEANYKADANRPVSLSPTAAQSQFYGKTIELEAGATMGYCEWSFDTDTFISKVLPLPEDSVFGDSLDFEVWTRPGVMGPDAVMVTRYAADIPLTSQKVWPWVTGSGAGKIPSYCTVRCYYHKAAGATRRFGVVAEFLI